MWKNVIPVYQGSYFYQTNQQEIEYQMHKVHAHAIFLCQGLCFN